MSAPHSTATIGAAAVALAAVLWAVMATVAATLFGRGVPPLELAQARAVIAATGLWIAAGRSRSRTPSAPWTQIVALGAAIALVNAFYYVAIDRVPVAVAIVLQYTAPALVVAWNAGRARAAPPAGVAVALVGALIGVVLVSGVDANGFGSADAIGIACGVGSALMFATYTLVSEGLGRVLGPLEALKRAFLVASLLWVAFQIPRGWPAELFEARNLPLVLLVGVAGTLVPFWLYLWGIRQIAAERAAIVATLEPVAAALAAFLWLGQTLSARQLAGGLIVVIAIVILQMRGREARPPEP